MEKNNSVKASEDTGTHDRLVDMDIETLDKNLIDFFMALCPSGRAIDKISLIKMMESINQDFVEIIQVLVTTKKFSESDLKRVTELMESAKKCFNNLEQQHKSNLELFELLKNGRFKGSPKVNENEV